MKPSQVFFLLFLYLGYIGYQVYDFYNGPDSELAVVQAQLGSIQASIAEKQRKVEESKAFYRTLDVKRAELRKLSETLISMKATLSESVDMPAFMKMLITEAQRIGLQITSINPSPREKATYYVEQPLELSFSGVFIQLLAYLDRLSQSSRIIHVETIQLRPDVAKNKNVRYAEVNGTIRVKTYFYLVTRDDDLARNPGTTPPEATGVPR